MELFPHQLKYTLALSWPCVDYLFWPCCKKGKRSIAQGAYINFRGGAVFAVVFMASSQAAAACGETDQLKCRTPIINNYFSMTVLKLGLSFTCISLSPENLNKKKNKKNTSSPIVEHLKYIGPVLKCWCGLALNGQVMWPWGDEEMSRIRKSMLCSRFCVFCFLWKRSLLLEGLFNQINKPNVFLALGVCSIIFKQLWWFKVLLFLTPQL